MTESSKYALFDKRKAPLIVITFTGNKDSPQAFHQYLEELDSCYEPRKKIGLLLDARTAIIPKLKHQKEQGLWLQKNWFTVKTYCLGAAYVINSAAVRAVLRMIFSFQHQPAPYRVFSDMQKAKAWLKNLEEKDLVN